jgi:hypothetical protein
MMAAALALLAAGDSSRNLHLFDRFEGMPPPGVVDHAVESGKLASVLLNEPQGRRQTYGPTQRLTRCKRILFRQVTRQSTSI